MRVEVLDFKDVGFVAETKKKKVLMYYSYGNMIGGPLTYINTVMNSDLKYKYDFSTCFQNKAPGGIDLKLLKAMAKEIKAQNPDIVHIQGLQAEGFYGVLAARLAGCKNIVTTVHGFAFDSHLISGAKKLIYRYFVEPATIRLSKKIYCVCDYAAKRDIVVKNAKKRNCGVIHNSAAELKAEEPGETIRSRYNIKKDNTVFVISGRVCREKGFAILAEAVKILNEKCGDSYRLFVLGNGDYLQEFCETLKEEIKSNRVIPVGQTDRVADYLNASDVFILPSLHENLPIAVLEAGRFGLPVIASDVGGMPELIKDGESGFLVHGFSPRDFEKKMEFFINNKDSCRKMGSCIKDDFAKRFSLKNMCDKIGEVYEQSLT